MINFFNVSLRARMTVSLLLLLLLLTSACGGPALTQPGPSGPPDDGRRLYIREDAGLYKVRVSDGKLLWRHPSSLEKQTPIILKNIIYGMRSSYAMNSSYAFGLDPQTGGERWTTPLDGGDVFAADEAGMYIGSRNTLFRLDPTNGVATWKRVFNTINIGALLVSHSVLYVADGNENTVYALDEATGQVRWQQDTGFPRAGVRLGLVGTTLVVISSGGMVGFDTQSGKKAWSNGIMVKPQGTYTGPFYTTGEDHVFAFVQEGSLLRYVNAGLVSIKADSGEVDWKMPLPPKTTERFFVTPDGAYIELAGDQIFQVEAVSLVTGQVKWTADLASPVSGIRTTSSSERLGVISSSATTTYVETSLHLYAFDASTGKQRWMLPSCFAFQAIKDALYRLGCPHKGGNYGVSQLDENGKVKWSVDLPEARSNSSLGPQMTEVQE